MIITLLAYAALSVATTEDPIKVAHAFVSAVTDNMPLWDADPISKYERSEITLVKNDILACSAAATDQDYLIDVEQLRTDWNVLVRLDKSLQSQYVL